MGYLEVLRATLTTYGIPQALYSDRAGIFFVNTGKQENWRSEEALAGHAPDRTQFGTTVADKPGIDLIGAHTPQAKGRVERLRLTLQDRLKVRFILNDIASIEQANAALPEFISEQDSRFRCNPLTALLSRRTGKMSLIACLRFNTTEQLTTAVAFRFKTSCFKSSQTGLYPGRR
ncbi:MAG: hypothetical protein LBD73_01405 [Deferribacteraceae bacterium]|jgi:hypothetical protein|nr:hypothetical protein [Deferribacteraceae bacterium]